MRNLLVLFGLVVSFSSFATCNVRSLTILADENVANYGESLKDHFEINLSSRGYSFNKNLPGLSMVLGYQDEYSDLGQIEVKVDRDGNIINPAEVARLEAEEPKHLSRSQLMIISDGDGKVLASHSKNVSKNKSQKKIISDLLIKRIPNCANLN